MATGDLLQATKAKYGALVAAAVGFVAPGAAYLLTVDSDGISGTEWGHGGLIAIVAAAGAGLTVGGVVYKTENKPKTAAIESFKVKPDDESPYTPPSVQS